MRHVDTHEDVAAADHIIAGRQRDNLQGAIARLLVLLRQVQTRPSNTHRGGKTHEDNKHHGDDHEIDHHRRCFLVHKRSARGLPA